MPMPAPARLPASPIQPGTSSLNGTTMTNRTTLAQLREMDAAQAARLPVDHLALLLEEVGALKADAKHLADLLHDALHARYGAPAAAARRAEGKDTGRVRIADDAFEVVADLLTLVVLSWAAIPIGFALTWITGRFFASMVGWA
jgi:hypothetical protein